MTLFYNQWEPWRKQALQQAFEDAWSWLDGGMTSFQGTPIADPPTNQEPLVDGVQHVATVLTEADAWALYLAHLGHSLAVEILGLVPWSLCDFQKSSAELKQILDGGSHYSAATSSVYPGYTVQSSVTPSHPTFTYPFLLQNGMIGATRLDTIANLLEWSRGMQHFVGPFTPDNMEAHWQYRGQPPIRRIIEGTVLDPSVTTVFPNPLHWTKGCWGTNGFLREVLRAVNVPVAFLSINHPACGHATPYFGSEDLYMSHGDDPYVSYWQKPSQPTAPPMQDFLISPATYAAWFQSDPNEVCNNIGRQPIELLLTELPESLVDLHCEDVATGFPHYGTQVYYLFASYYTLQELEAMNLWSQLDQRAIDLGIPCP